MFVGHSMHDLPPSLWTEEDVVGRSGDEREIGDNNRDESALSTDVQIVKKKRFRPNKKRYLVNNFPRVLKRDIRRCFPQMMVNVINDGSVSLLRSFFETFCSPHAPYEEYLQSPMSTAAQQQPFPFPLSGGDALMIGVRCSHLLSPDCTGSLISAQICQRANSNYACELKLDFLYKGTRVFDFAPVPAELFTSLSQSVPTDTTTAQSPPPDAQTPSSALDLDHLLLQRPLVRLVAPVVWMSYRRITLSLDAEHRVVHISSAELYSPTTTTTRLIPETPCMPSAAASSGVVEGGLVPDLSPPLSTYLAQTLTCATQKDRYRS